MRFAIQFTTKYNIYFFIFSKVVRELKEKIKNLEEQKVNFEINQVIYKEMNQGVVKRCTKIEEVKNLTSREVRRVFNEQIRDCNMKGNIEIM